MYLRQHGIWIVAVLSALVALAFGILIGSSISTANEPAFQTRQDLIEFSEAFAQIAEKVNPSVVNISCTEPETSFDEEEDHLEDRYGFGSGVIIDPQGFILTSNHVIEGAAKIEVKTSDSQQFVAKLVGQDQETDLALIKVESQTPLSAAPLGDSDILRPGQWVMAIGNPFVFDHTVTVGVISALNRRLGTTIFDNFIQTDAAINFGNSGGPLLNLKGEVIGINTLISSQGTGIGFSIPINTAKEILPQLKQKGSVSRGFLGLVPQDITPDLRKALELSMKEGVLISSIQRGTPADKAGLRRYDVILEFGGKKVESEDQFRRLIAEAAPGTRVHMKVLREDRMLGMEVELGARNGVVKSELPPIDEEKRLGKMGLEVGDLEAAQRKLIGEESGGVLVLKVQPGSSADTAGLMKGDIILEINKKQVTDAESFRKQLDGAKTGQILLLYVFHSHRFTLLSLSVP